jgi:hypothetical protein
MGCGFLKYNKDRNNGLISNIKNRENIFQTNATEYLIPSNNNLIINENMININTINVNRKRINSVQKRSRRNEARKEQGILIEQRGLNSILNYNNRIRSTRVNSNNSNNRLERFPNYGTVINRRINHNRMNTNNILLRNINTINSIEDSDNRRNARIIEILRRLGNNGRIINSNRYSSSKKKQKKSNLLKQLKVTKIDKKILHSDNKSCSICLQDFKNKESAIYLPCFHLFHRKCIDKWLETKGKCPLCKNNIKELIEKQ